MKSNQIVSITRDGTKLTFTAIGSGSVALDVAGLAPSVTEQATYHGLAQKVRDAAAIKRVLVGGVEIAATPKHKLDAMSRVVEALVAGRWNAVREGGGRIGADETLLSRALVAVYPAKAPDEIRAKVTAMTAEERKAVLQVPKIKAAADAIRAAEVADVNTEVLLADFE
jgi:acyl dehydratase